MTPMERNRGWETAINADRQYEQQQTSEQARLAQLQDEFKRLVSIGAFDTAEGGGTAAGNWSDRAIRSERPDEAAQRGRQGWKDIGISMIPGGQTYLEYRKGQEYPERTPDYAKSVLADLTATVALMLPFLRAGGAGSGARYGLTSARTMEGPAFSRGGQAPPMRSGTSSEAKWADTPWFRGMEQRDVFPMAEPPNYAAYRNSPTVEPPMRSGTSSEAKWADTPWFRGMEQRDVFPMVEPPNYAVYRNFPQ